MKRRVFIALIAACATAPFVRRQASEDASRARVRAPQAGAVTAGTVNESWGLLRDVSDVADGAVSGTWGAARRIRGQLPLESGSFGTPRFFLDGEPV